jgi:acetyltransferase-like isoleucine patch superfamily enzyme
MIHPTAEVDPRAEIGPETKVWRQVQVREGARIGRNCILGRGVYVDWDVRIGDNCKLENDALIFHGAELQDGVFIGPAVCLTNDRLPRAIRPDGRLKTLADWTAGRILICYGASVGARSVILPDLTIGRFALVGAGSVVTRDVPDHGLVIGNPARLVGYVCRCAQRLVEVSDGSGGPSFVCPDDGERYRRSPDGGLLPDAAGASEPRSRP